MEQRHGIELLHWAGMKDDFLNEIQFLLNDHPEFINYENKYGENALHVAARVNNFEIFKWFIENTQINYNKKIDKGNVLLIAIENSNHQIARYLLENTDIDYKVKTEDNQNIFNYLMQSSSDFLLDFLIEKFPEGINNIDKHQQNCLFDFIVYYPRNKKSYIFDMILEHMDSEVFAIKNKMNQNLLQFTKNIIKDSKSKVERVLKEELYSSVLGQLEHYLED